MAAKKTLHWLMFFNMIIFMLAGCSQQNLSPTIDETLQPSAMPTLSASETPSLLPTDTHIPTNIVTTQASEKFPLAERGPFWIGRKTYTLIDEGRSGREVRLVVRYPAIKELDSAGTPISDNALPDLDGAPYPLILTGLNSGSYLFQSHLVSHGFVMVTVLNLESYLIQGFEVVDHPLDLIFTLDQIGENKLTGLNEIINSDQVGVAGYSSDGDYSLAVSGARIDPEYYFSKCGHMNLEEIQRSEFMVQYMCELALEWEQFADHVGEEITVSDDGLWQPISDERIRAVMPMAAGIAWLFGDQGLASVDRPVLMIAGTEDTLCPYRDNTVYIFKNLMLDDKYLVSFLDKGHMMITEQETINRIRHFATAFFGYYLQGRQDYAFYFSEEFVNQYPDLAWGIYSGD